MTRPRLWIAFVLAGATLGDPVAAQEPTDDPTGEPVPSAPAKPSSGSSGSGTGGNAPASADDGAASSFGTPSSGTPAPAKPAAPTQPTTTEPAPTPSTGGGGSGLPEPATSFSVPGTLGRPGETFTVGQGRLARPRYRFSGSVAIGFDDNIFGTPTKQQNFPDRRVTVVIRPEQDVQVPVYGIQFVNGIRTPVVIGFRTERQPELTQETLVPGQKTQPRESSFVSRANVGLEVQFASRRTVFILDGRLGTEYVAARDEDPLQYFGSLGVRFVHKLAPRLQWDAAIDGTYTQQPDFSRANTPTTVTAGSYLNLIARTGLSYRWTPRITTSANLSYNNLTFTDQSEQNSDYQGVTYSVEGRYLFNPRITALAELRYGTIAYANDQARDSSSTFVLAGADWKVTPRLSSTFRAGLAMRDTETSGTATSPYFEMNLNYRLARASQVQWVMSYGFEEPSDASAEVVTWRNGLSYIQYFTPRLRAVASGNLLYSSTTYRTGNGQDFDQLAFDTNLGLEYNINRRWTFTGTYSFTTVFSDNEFSEYYRNRLFLGFQYAF